MRIAELSAGWLKADRDSHHHRLLLSGRQLPESARTQWAPKSMKRSTCESHPSPEALSVRPPAPSFRSVPVMGEGVLPSRNPFEPGALVLPACPNRGNGSPSAKLGSQVLPGPELHVGAVPPSTDRRAVRRGVPARPCPPVSGEGAVIDERAAPGSRGWPRLTGGEPPRGRGGDGAPALRWPRRHPLCRPVFVPPTACRAGRPCPPLSDEGAVKDEKSLASVQGGGRPVISKGSDSDTVEMRMAPSRR